MEQTIKSKLLSLGADACGIAAVDRFADAPAGFHPTDIFPACRGVVVFLKRQAAGLTQVGPRIVYNHANNLTLAEVDRITLAASLAIEHMGGTAVPLPCDGPYEYWDAERTEGRGLLSMRHAAVLAGLGQLGKNTLLIHPQFGNMVSIGAILTDLPLLSDPMVAALCKKDCRACLNACPVHALDGVKADQKLCRAHAYATNARGFDVCNCNKCRVVCPLALGSGA